MAIVTTKASSRLMVLNASNDGQLVEFGPAGTNNNVGTMTMQFKASLGANFQLAVMGRVFGLAADSADIPFGPIPYRIVTLANVAQDYSIVSDLISTEATIQVPANGLSIAVLFTISNGTVTVAAWDMIGPSAV